MSEGEKIDITWLEPIKLRLTGDEDREKLIARLKREISDAGAVADLARSVYIIRMSGSFVIDYPDGPSPVIYVGRGDSITRLAQHLKRWASDVFTWGSDTYIEVRILRPSRRNRVDYFKNVEADLLRIFWRRYGSLPMMNKRFEVSYEMAVDYGASQYKLLWSAMGIGKGNRHKWAIRPLPSNPHHNTYVCGQ